MNLENVKYDAFISYRHKDLDQFVAVTLHKELEAFRLPKKLQKALAKNGMTKKKIERVFRDRDELPITNNLADPIMNALSNSEYLLVICTPRLPESIWCKTEVENFIKMHGRERVFAVLAEGEPAESFPEALLYEEREVEDENGNKVMQKVPVEPLAADVRGASKKEIRKKIKEEVLRLAAPMFDCSYDDLKQRHREQKIKRIITASLSATAVFGAFAVVSTTMALQIHKQSGQIKEQAAKIEEQYTEALKVNAKNMAKDALELADYGDKKGAAELAYSALKGTEEEPMPYTADAEYALSEALMVYKDGYAAVPVEVVEMESAVNFVKMSPDMTRFLAVDNYGNMMVYDVVESKVLAEVEAVEDNMYMNENGACFITNDVFAYIGEACVVVYDVIAQTERTIGIEVVHGLCVSDNGKYLLVNQSEGITIYETDGLSIVYEISDNEFNPGIKYDFSPNENIVGYSCDDGIVIVDVKQQEIFHYKSGEWGISDIYCCDDYVYVGLYSTDILNTDGYVVCLDLQGKEMWKVPTNCFVSKMQTFGKGKRDKLVYYGYGMVGVLSINDGSLIGVAQTGAESVVGLACYSDSDNISYVLGNGVIYLYDVVEDISYDMSDKVLTNSSRLKKFCFGNQFFVSNAYNDIGITIYKYYVGKKVEEVVRTDNMISDLEVNAGATQIAILSGKYDENMIDIVEKDTGEKITTISCGDMILDYSYNNDDNLLVLTTNNIALYNTENGENIYNVEIEKEGRYFGFTDAGFILNDNESVAVKTSSGIYVLDSKNADIVFECSEEENQLDSGYLFDVSYDGLWYAYSNQNKNEVVIGNFETKEKKSISMNVKVLKAISYLDGMLYTSQMNGKVSAYDVSTGELIKTYSDIDILVEDAENMNGYTILHNGYSAYILNEGKEIIGKVDNYSTHDKKTDCFYLTQSYTVYCVPRYLQDMLLEEANGI